MNESASITNEILTLVKEWEQKLASIAPDTITQKRNSHNSATYGNNDRWIAIQDYQNEEWMIIIQLWKYSLLHFCHVIENVKQEKLENEWISGPDTTITLKTMIVDFPKHIKLHLGEIEELAG